jgi:hypothetical protein
VSGTRLSTWKKSTVEAVNAIANATRYQPEWFWRGAQHAKKWEAKIPDNLNRRTPRH